MTDDSPLSTLIFSIRAAVASGAYEQAGGLLATYCERLPASGDRLAQELTRATDLFDWMFRMVSAARAHDTAQLTALRRASPYRHPKVDAGPSWQLDG